jgi:hypothetical protein
MKNKSDKKIIYRLALDGYSLTCSMPTIATMNCSFVWDQGLLILLPPES